MATVFEQTERIGVMQALGLAMVRKAERLTAIQSELAELERENVFCPYTAAELWLLESVGLLYDLTTGEVLEVQQ